MPPALLCKCSGKSFTDCTILSRPSASIPLTLLGNSLVISAMVELLVAVDLLNLI